MSMSYQDMSKKDLRGIKFDHESFIFTNFAMSEMPESMIGANLFGCDMTGARISLRCSTFHDLVVDQRNFKMLMFILSKMRVHGFVGKETRQQLKELLKKDELTYESILKAIVPSEEYTLMEQHNEDEIL